MAVTTAANEGVPADQARPAAAVLNASQQVGGALGLAVFSAIATARTGHLLAASGGDELQVPASAAGPQPLPGIRGALRAAHHQHRGEEPEDSEEARDRAGAGHVERLWYLPSPDAALWAREGPP